MQLFMILGLFGLIAAVISGFGTSFLFSAAQWGQHRDKTVRQIFRDVEYAVNKGVLTRRVDLQPLFAAGASTAQPADLTFSALGVDAPTKFLSWPLTALQRDPWQQPYQVYVAKATNSVDKLLYTAKDATGVVQTVQAPLTAVALVSSGPDVSFQTVVPANATYAQLRTLSAAGDDIVHTFTTYAPMAAMWNQFLASEQKVEAAAVADYRQKYALFSSTVAQQLGSDSTAYDNAVAGLEGNTAFAALDPRALGLSSSVGYPVVSSDVYSLGASAELKGALLAQQGYDITLSAATGSTGTITIGSPSSPSWDISFTKKFNAFAG